MPGSFGISSYVNELDFLRISHFFSRDFTYCLKTGFNLNPFVNLNIMQIRCFNCRLAAS